jgi:hypothetical protein
LWVDDLEAVIAAAGRFWSAWTTAIESDGDDTPPADLVIEVHEAARELIRATRAEDLRGAYDVLDCLVLEIKQADPRGTTRCRAPLGRGWASKAAWRERDASR